MDILTSIHGRRMGLGPADELLLSGKAIYLDNNGTPVPVARVGTDKYIAAGASKILTRADAGRVIKLDTLAGSVVTLPAAVGSGAKFRALVAVLATSASHKIQVANAQDFMIGLILGSRVDSGNAVLGFAAANSGTVATNSDTITLNRSTTGSVTVGEYVDLEDVAANTWQVSGLLSATGAAFATPFSAAV
ncbi:MAG: hypothetical protein V4673_14475 [Pseudomonadota bacterium]